MTRIAKVAGKIAAGTGIVLMLLIVGLLTMVAQPYWPMLVGVVAILGLLGVAAWLSKRFAVVMLILTSLLTVVVTGSQLTASTPTIVDAQGKVVPGSIAEMRTVNLGGTDQWIVIRGRNVNNPILLSLAGGPGESDMFESKVIPRLEDRFVVVNWDQRGAGKSAGVFFADNAHMTVQQYVSDGLQLTNYLRQRFHRNQIYVAGISWGTMLGVLMVQRHPEWYRAYIGTSQIVNWKQQEQLEYQLALQYARQAGDRQTVQTLETNGPPPYQGNPLSIFTKDFLSLNYSSETYMDKLVEKARLPQTPAPISDFSDSPEYGLAGRVSWYLGLILSYVGMYEQLLQIDLMQQAPVLDVPVFFASGRLDIHMPQALTEQYFQALEAPHKELVWFERSGHLVDANSPDEYYDFMFNRVLAQTQGPGI